MENDIQKDQFACYKFSMEKKVKFEIQKIEMNFQFIKFVFSKSFDNQSKLVLANTTRSSNVCLHIDQL